MTSLSALRNTARSAVVNAAVRMAPRAVASAPLRVAPALWSRSFASGFLPKDEVASRVMDVVKNFQNVDPAKVTATSHFINDLGLDSLDTVEVCSIHCWQPHLSPCVWVTAFFLRECSARITLQPQAQGLSRGADRAAIRTGVLGLMEGVTSGMRA